MTTHFSMGAINNLTGLYEYPTIAVKTNVYSCPDCKKNVILKKGNIKIHHFAHHKSENPCSYYNNPGESQIHKDAKLLLKTLLENKRSICFKRNCDTCSETKLFNTIEYTDKSKTILEHPFKYNNSSKQADVALLNDNNIAYIFEICYKHKTLEENRPEPWFEIDAEALQKNKDILNTENTNIGIVCLRKYKCNKCIVREKIRLEQLKIETERLEKIENQRLQKIEIEELERKKKLEESQKKEIERLQSIKDTQNKLKKIIDIHIETYLKHKKEILKSSTDDFIYRFTKEQIDEANVIKNKNYDEIKKQLYLLSKCRECSNCKHCSSCSKIYFKELNKIKTILPTLQDILNTLL